MEEKRPKVGIVGAGAMGTLFGYHLAQRCDVTVLDSNEETGRAIARDGLVLNDAPARAVTVATNPRELYGSHALFLFVKAVDTLRALRPFAGELNPASPVVSLQNGIGNEDAIKTALGGAVPVILGVTTESSHTLAPGRVRSSDQGNTILGSTSASPDDVAKHGVAAHALRVARVGGVRYPPAPLGQAGRERRHQRTFGAARLRRGRARERSQRGPPRRSARRKKPPPSPPR